MRYQNFFDIKWNYKTISLFVFLIAIPNVLGLINISTPWGFNIHFFQVAIFLAALIYGPMGGLTSGLVGSIYTAAMMNNQYIVVGNVILGFFVGLFAKKFNVIIAVLLAFIIQLPWLLATDYYLIHMPTTVLKGLVIALLVSNIIWALIAMYTYKPIKATLQ